MAEEDFVLSDVFAEIARQLLAEEGHQATLDRICTLAVATIDACEHAGVSLLEGRRIHQVSSTGDVPQTVDAFVEELGEGPCIDAVESHVPVLTGDLRQDDRWLDFGRRAYDSSGVQSIASFPLSGSPQTYGVLNLYSKQAHAFTDDDVHMATIFSAHAVVAVAAMHEQQHFDAALAGRDVIGVAKGILMARSNVSDDEAFDLLRKASQRMNRKLRDVAEAIATGEGPTRDL